MSREDGEMISFASIDIHKRVQALRDALDRPSRRHPDCGG
jgi:hypothetical protein